MPHEPAFFRSSAEVILKWSKNVKATSVRISVNISWKAVLRRVLIPPWDKRPKCFSDQNVSAKKWSECLSEKKAVPNSRQGFRSHLLDDERRVIFMLQVTSYWPTCWWTISPTGKHREELSTYPRKHSSVARWVVTISAFPAHSAPR